jgi:serine protease Do
MSNRRLMLFPAVAVSVIAATVGVWTLLPSKPADGAPPSTAPTAVSPSIFDNPGINLRRTVTVQVVQKTKGAVVNISTTKLVARHVMIGYPQFARPIDTGRIAEVHATSLGSGFIIHPDGYVVTNNHVVDHAREITVELADGRKLPADLISADPDADLAVLRVHSNTPLPTLEMGESNDLMIGEPVIAVGNPLGFSHTVSTGIVSAVHRDIEPPSDDDEARKTPLKGEDAALRDLIQTDAAINLGNSGGPLLNAYGQVIAINTAIKANAQNIGFAIPIDRLRDLIPELMNPSEAIKVDIPVKLIERRSMTEPATVNVSIVDNKPGGAVLESIDGHHPADIVDAYAMLLKTKPGQSVTFTWAGNKTQKVAAMAAPIPDAIVQAKRLLGLTVVQNTPMLALKNQDNPRDDGLLITAVDAGSLGEKSKFQPGDVIFQVGRFPTPTLNDFGALVPRFPAHGEGAAAFVIQRGNQTGQVIVRF